MKRSFYVLQKLVIQPDEQCCEQHFTFLASEQTCLSETIYFKQIALTKGAFCSFKESLIYDKKKNELIGREKGEKW
jgi:hypothetical protein